MSARLVIVVLGLVAASCRSTVAPPVAQRAPVTFAVAGGPQYPDFMEPFPAFKIVGNVYYVGSRGLATYLVTSAEGHILINSNLESSVPMIRQGVESLGFRFGDVRVLLISHAHWDHCAGSADLVRATGAKYMVMEGDAAEVEAGGRGNFQYDAPERRYKPARVDRVLHDGDEVKVGDAVLVAHKTPGHTKGCTTWTTRVRDAGKTYDVVVIGSPNVNDGYKLVGNALYPEIVADYETTFRVLTALPCDVFLGAHGNYYDMEAKLGRRKEGAVNPFIDPEGYRRWVADRERAYRAALEKQSGR